MKVYPCEFRNDMKYVSDICSKTKIKRAWKKEFLVPDSRFATVSIILTNDDKAFVVYSGIVDVVIEAVRKLPIPVECNMYKDGVPNWVVLVNTVEDSSGRKYKNKPMFSKEFEKFMENVDMGSVVEVVGLNGRSAKIVKVWTLDHLFGQQKRYMVIIGNKVIGKFWLITDVMKALHENGVWTYLYQSLDTADGYLSNHILGCMG